MAWSVFEDGLSGAGDLGDGDAEADLGVQDERSGDAAEEYSGLGEGLSTDYGGLAAVDEDHDALMGLGQLAEEAHEAGRGGEVEGGGADRDEDSVGLVDGCAGGLAGGVLRIDDAGRAVDEDDVEIGIGGELGEASTERACGDDVERKAVLPAGEAPHGRGGLRVRVDDEDAVMGLVEASGEVHGGGGFATSALLVCDCDKDGHGFDSSAAVCCTQVSLLVQHA